MATDDNTEGGGARPLGPAAGWDNSFQVAAVGASPLIKTLLEDPLSQVLRSDVSMPGVAVRTAAVLPVTVGDGTSFPTAAHLASCAHLAPAPGRRDLDPRRTLAQRRKPAARTRHVLSDFATLHDLASRTYYDKSRARGKSYTQALLRLARHRISVLFAMLRDDAFYEPGAPNQVAHQLGLDERHRGPPPHQRNRLAIGRTLPGDGSFLR